MQSAAALVLFVVVGVSLVHSQMTFSDGWGKRSAGWMNKRSVPLDILDDDAKGVNNPLLDECHVSYSQSLVDLHHKIMVLYEKYQQCQNHAIEVFQRKQQQPAH